jgi:predicted transcriptional regulator
MARAAQDVTEAELALMRQLWDGGPATIRRLADELYPGGGPAQYATVQKLLDRLEDKGCVRRDRSANVHVFTAAVGRDDLIGLRLQAIAESLCEGSLTPILTQLVSGRPLTADERQSLRDLIDRLDRSPRKPHRR